jgi:ATP-dependent exoDNAse (exonuclease V) alpha subunit
MTIILNEQQLEVIDVLENTNNNVYLTGKAGTGKSTVITSWLKSTEKKVLITAPTGVAALNIGGTTLHNALGIHSSVTFENLENLKITGKRARTIQKIDVLLIDEISMVRADLLDIVDRVLRIYRFNEKPFGGLQVVFVGDLFQLPPVLTDLDKGSFYKVYSTEYFFSSHVFSDHMTTFKCLNLDTIFRQTDQTFLYILNNVRKGKATQYHADLLNKCVNPVYEQTLKDFTITLTSTNKEASAINEDFLSKLYQQEEIKFFADIYGNIPSNMYPTDEVLTLKIGAQVMILVNDKNGEYVNGTIGEIVDIVEDENLIIVEKEDGKRVGIGRYAWEHFEMSYDESSQTLKNKSVGGYSQYPLKLSWAITVHKSQGKTFDKAIIDTNNFFAPGQIYVALSRCSSLEGLILKNPLTVYNLNKVDPRLVGL